MKKYYVNKYYFSIGIESPPSPGISSSITSTIFYATGYKPLVYRSAGRMCVDFDDQKLGFNGQKVEKAIDKSMLGYGHIPDPRG